MKKIILSSLFALSLASMGSFPAAFAGDDCTCDQECTEKCSEGDHKECTCESCDCSKGKECKHGKCSTHKHKKSAKKAAGATADAPKTEEAHAH